MAGSGARAGASFPNVVLIGSRASGKSRASRKLAEAVGWTRISTDELLEARLGPIPSFVERFGWGAISGGGTPGSRGRRRESGWSWTAGEASWRTPAAFPASADSEPSIGSAPPAAVLRERLSRPKHRDSRPTLTGIPPAEEAALMLERRDAALPGSRRVRRVEHRFGRDRRRGSLRDAAGGPFRAAAGAHGRRQRRGRGACRPRCGQRRVRGPLDLIELRLDTLDAPAPRGPARDSRRPAPVAPPPADRYRAPAG